MVANEKKRSIYIVSFVYIRWALTKEIWKWDMEGVNERSLFKGRRRRIAVLEEEGETELRGDLQTVDKPGRQQ